MADPTADGAVTTDDRTAVVLAGGRSTRFEGGDKLLADLAGEPLLRRTVARLAPVVGTVVVNCRGDQRDAFAAALAGLDADIEFAVDPDPDAGPMAGIRTGLRAAPTEFAVVVAGDMPFVDGSLVRYLFERAAGHDAAVPRIGEWFQTTQAVYRTEAMADACDRALDRGASKILAPLEELDWTVVEESRLRANGWLDSFENVNTHEELTAAEERFREG
ncbi:molybdenum cofactor guanylyltransferase [Haloglomus halophilum]|uniref:molybdenum cofactor guanylyltransferase n=1 Tax=Haloglomus halophilum TaxID=2962672 RepID=UPI0020C99FDA|nr:molybdenum cofactor guanylyltransferase [Haloglomus halophilum]